MPNPFEVAPPNIGNVLQNLMQGYKTVRGIGNENAIDAARQRAAQQLQSGDQQGAFATLMGIDPPSAAVVGNYGNQSFNQNIQSEQLKLAQQASRRREEPEAARNVRAAGVDPASPEGRKMMFPRTDTPISATDKAAIFKAENDIPALDATIKNVTRAKELNPQVFSGLGASTRGSLGAMLPDLMVPDVIADKKGSDATVEWDQVMGAEAIKNMSETLKGASTDFEMKKFLAIAADTSKPEKVRAAAMDRFLSLAQDERALRVRRFDQLREQTYFKPGGGLSGPKAAPQSGGGDPLASARDAISRGADRNAVIKRLQENGINPAGL